MDHVLDTYRREGLLRLDNMFTQEELERAQEAFADLIANPPKGVGIIKEDGDTTQIRSVMGWHRDSDTLRDFALDERVFCWVQAILGNDLVFHQTKWNPKAPNAKGEKWDPHRGDTFWSLFDGVPNPKGMLSVFIAITDQTEENGAVYAWPGSHSISLEEVRPHIMGLEKVNDVYNHTAADLALQIRPMKLIEISRHYPRTTLIGPAGTVWVLDAGLLHASEANISDATRVLVVNVFRQADNVPLTPRAERYLCEIDTTPLIPSVALEASC